MIKTLKITSIAAVGLTVVFLIFSVTFGVRSDKASEEIIDSIGAVEKFKKETGDKVAKRKNEQTPPLVKQAEAFALYLNPPPKPKPKPRPGRTTRKPDTKPRPPKVSAKFDLVGTSFYKTAPEQSIALIDQPGKGFQWIRQSEKIGHLVIKEIKDGVIVIQDGKRTFEMTAQRKPRISLVKEKGKSAKETTSKSRAKSSSEKRKKRSEVRQRRARHPQPQPGREKATDFPVEIFEKLQAMQKDAERGNVDEEEAARQSELLMLELIADIEGQRISGEEANDLGTLGEELDAAEVVPAPWEDSSQADEPNSDS